MNVDKQVNKTEECNNSTPRQIQSSFSITTKLTIQVTANNDIKSAKYMTKTNGCSNCT